MPATTQRPSGQPHKVLPLSTYQRLEEYLRAFAQGHFHLLILVGAGGLAKSRSVRAVLDGKGCWIEGNATPFGMYIKLYQHRDQFVVIDDVDALYADRSGVRLLKCLCQTEEEKSVAWHSDALGLERQRVHRKAGEWFDDREIYAGKLRKPNALPRDTATGGSSPRVAGRPPWQGLDVEDRLVGGRRVGSPAIPIPSTRRKSTTRSSTYPSCSATMLFRSSIRPS